MTLSASDILSPGGLIAGRLTNYEQRPEQLEMASGVEQAFADKEHLLAEAGTGVGKSFAYLVPAILQVDPKRRVVVSTYTIALQEQLITKDLPFLADIMPVEFRAVLCKGRNNYLCFRRLELALRNKNKLFATESRLEQLQAVADWAAKTPGGSLQDIEFPVAPEVWQKVRAESGLCRRRDCRSYGRCHYQRARRQVLSADVLVVNHALFFADLVLRAKNVSLLANSLASE